MKDNGSSKVDFVKKKLDRFEEVGFEPIKRPDLPPVKIGADFDWAIDPFEDENWVFQLNTLRYLRPYIQLSRLEDDAFYLHKFLDLLNGWVSCNAKGESKGAWSDMASGIRGEVVSEALIEANRISDQSSIEALQEIAHVHIDRMMSDGFVNINHNHAVFVLHGIRALGEAVGGEKRGLAKKFVDNYFEALVDKQFDIQGVHKEHSPHYHLFILSKYEQVLSSGWYQDNEYLKSVLDKAREVAYFMVDEAGFEIPFGDTDNYSKPVSYPYLKADKSLRYAVYSSYGFVKNTSGKIPFTLAITNTKNSHTHKHSDNLSIFLSVSGNQILVDPGKYSYNKKDSLRKTFMSSEYHNCSYPQNKIWSYKDIVDHDLCLGGMDAGVLVIKGDVRLDGLGCIRRELITDCINYVIIKDSVPGGGKSSFNFSPLAQQEMAEESVVVSFQDGYFSNILFLGFDTLDFSDSHFSSAYNRREPSRKLDVYFRDCLLTGISIDKSFSKAKLFDEMKKWRF